MTDPRTPAENTTFCAKMPMPRHPGRPTITEQLGLTTEVIVAAYKEHKTLGPTAAALKISESTLKNYLKAAKSCGAQGRPQQPYAWRRKGATPVYEWFREHRNTKLPRSAVEIATLSGFKVSQIRKFLWSRKRAAHEYLVSLGPLNELPGVVIDIRGRKIPLDMVQAYELTVDSYNLTVKITGVLKFGGEVHAMLPFRQIQQLYESTTTDPLVEVPVAGTDVTSVSGSTSRVE